MAQLGRGRGKGHAVGDWDDVPFNDGGATRGDAGRVGRSVDGASHGLGRRFGLAPRKGTIVACCLVAAALAALGMSRTALAGGGFQLTQATESDEVAVEPVTVDANVDDGPIAGAETTPDVTPELVVHVDGAVRQPGVYRLALDDPRIADAVDAAGGLADDADTTQLNLAQSLEDGMKVHVWRQGEANAPTAVDVPVVGGGTNSPSSGGLVNINTASIDELKTLPGVGDATAQAIVDERTSNGAFASIDELMRVSGIGEKKYAKLKELICV